MIRRGIVVVALLLAVIVGVTVYGWIAAPGDALYPVHWNARGEVDRWSSKAEALLVVPVITLFLLALFALPLANAAFRERMRQSPTPHVVGWIGVLAFMTMVQVMMTLTATGVVAPETSGTLTPRVMLAALSMFLIVLGNVLPKTRPNGFLGVRTPWTRASEYSWDRSQRLGGVLAMLSGVCGLAAAVFAPVALATAIVLAATLASAVVSVAMSYVWWKNDPSRGA